MTIKKLSFFSILLLMQCTLGAQNIKLCGNETTALLLDLNKVWNYNLYEHSRWGAGLVLQTNGLRPNEYNTFVLSAGYGVRDRQLKYLVGWEVLMLRSRHSLSQHITFGREYALAGSRRLSAPSIANIGSLSTVMSRRMSDEISFTWGYRWSVSGVKHNIEWSAIYGRRLFDATGLLYLCDGDRLLSESGGEIRYLLQSPHGLWTEIRTGGLVFSDEFKLFARLLVQYQRSFQGSLFNVDVFAQSGITPPQTPYTRLFDLGGTYGLALMFDNALLTALPNEFTANLFCLASARVAMAQPLFDQWNSLWSVGCRPRPFAVATIAWGHLWHQDGNGCLLYEGLPLRSPHMGVANIAVGINGLVRWGLTEWGLAAIFGLLPSVGKADYLVTASLSL